MKLGPFSFTFSRNQSSHQLREFGERAAIRYVGDLIVEIEALRGNASNKYISRRSQIAETVRKYKGQAVLGSLLVKNILNTRSAFNVGRGISITGWEPETAEGQFLTEFQRRNKFSLAYLRELGRERSYEGQVLLALQPGADGVPGMRYISWLDTNYEVKSSVFDYAVTESIYWDTTSQRQAIPPGQAAFFKFDTRINSNEGTPLFAGCLSYLEALDEQVGLLRSINKIAARPTPYFQFAPGGENDATAFQKRLAEENWQPGTALAGSASASMLQIGYGSYTSIENLALLYVKLISGHTGVPPHYFGFSELLNNRAVADDISAMYVRLSETETDQWSSGFTDLMGRAMVMYNNATGSMLDAHKGRLEVEQISREQFAQVMSVWLPSFLAGAIDTETYLSKLPTIDQAKVAPKVKAEFEARAGQTPGELIPPSRTAAMQFFRAFADQTLVM